MRSSGMGSTPRGAAGSVSPPRWDGLVDKSLFQSQVRHGRAEGSRAQCPGANPGAFSRCEFSQGGSPGPGEGEEGIAGSGGRGAEERRSGTRLHWGLGSQLSGDGRCRQAGSRANAGLLPVPAPADPLPQTAAAGCPGKCPGKVSGSPGRLPSSLTGEEIPEPFSQLLLL